MATPFTGVAVDVPVRPVPPLNASVTGLVAVVTVLPLLSCTATVTAGAIVAPVVALEGCCTNANLVAVGGGVPPPAVLIVKAPLTAGRSPALLADNVYMPALLTLRPLKVATPFCGVAVSVPARPLPRVSAIVTGFVAAVTGLPLMSSTATVTAGVMVAPADALEGCCTKASLAATGAPPPGALMVKPRLAAGIRPVLVAARVKVPALLTLRLLKVAMPLLGTTLNVPRRPLPPTMVSVTGLTAVDTVFPLMSCTTTVTAGAIVAPVNAFVGCCRNASFTGGGGALPPKAVMTKLSLVADVRLGLVAVSV